MPRDFLGKKILIITAHPDDESFLAAGTMYKNRQHGGQTVILCASFGERGDAFLKRPMETARLKALRKKELESAARFLGVRKLVLLRLPDTKIKEHAQSVFARGLSLVEHYKPHVIVSFGAYGFSGHYDHIAVGEVARRLARRSDIPLYTFTLSVRAARMTIRRLRMRARELIYTKKKPVFEKPTLRVAVDTKIKTKAIRFHASQLGGKQPFSNLPPALRRERLAFEYFHAADD